jgi:hypothetical protein
LLNATKFKKITKKKENIELHVESHCCCDTRLKSRRDDSGSKANELEMNNTQFEAREMRLELTRTFESEAVLNAVDEIDAIGAARFVETVTFESLEARAISDDAIGTRFEAIVTFESLNAMGMTFEANLEMSEMVEVRGASGLVLRSNASGM